MERDSSFIFSLQKSPLYPIHNSQYTTINCALSEGKSKFFEHHLTSRHEYSILILLKRYELLQVIMNTKKIMNLLLIIIVTFMNLGVHAEDSYGHQFQAEATVPLQQCCSVSEQSNSDVCCQRTAIHDCSECPYCNAQYRFEVPHFAARSFPALRHPLESYLSPTGSLLPNSSYLPFPPARSPPII